ncbi:MAG TPA: phosphoglycerate kinase [bacterium]|nr:phosphoglycerate kinase [bacterium]
MWIPLDQAPIAGKRVFLRSDLNVPLKEGKITDESRITASMRTLTYLLDQGCQVVMASHLGRPKGPDPKLSLRPVAERLSELLNVRVPLVEEYHAGDPFEDSSPAGNVALLENLRFYPGEEANDRAFAQTLARLSEVYVDDAFGTAHRPAASIVGIAELLPSYPGFLLYEEVEQLSRLLNLPPDGRPFAALIGGAKVSDKLPVLQSLLSHADLLLIGGAMAFTFIKADGGEVGDTLVEQDAMQAASDLLTAAEARGKLVFLPDDAVCGADIKGAAAGVHPADAIPPGLAAFDIGPETVEKYLDILEDANTIFWNGPVGVFENPAFAAGTLDLARGIAELEAFKVAGGGDSLAAIHQSGMGAGFNHLSTGGGASLELLSGEELPGVRVLKG